MTIPEVMDALRTALVSMSGLEDAQVLNGYQDAVRPSTAHIVILPGSERNVGRGQRVNASSVRSIKRLSVRLDARGDTAIAGLDLANERWMVSGPATRILYALGIAPQGRDLASDRTAKLTTHEPRWSVVWNLSFPHLDTNNPAGPVATAIAVGFETTTPDELEADPVATVPLP